MVLEPRSWYHACITCDWVLELKKTVILIFQNSAVIFLHNFVLDLLCNKLFVNWLIYAMFLYMRYTYWFVLSMVPCHWWWCRVMIFNIHAFMVLYSCSSYALRIQILYFILNPCLYIYIYCKWDRIGIIINEVKLVFNMNITLSDKLVFMNWLIYIYIYTLIMSNPYVIRIEVPYIYWIRI